jgi:hypothetical protein
MMPPMMGSSGPIGSPIANPIRYPRPVSPVMPQPIGSPPTAGPMPVRPLPRPIGPARPILGQFHKGGKVGKTGAYFLKKGEHVIAKGHRKMVNHEAQKMVSISALKA